MNFQNLGKIEAPDFFIDVAFKKANHEASLLRSQIRGRGITRLQKSRRIELVKIGTVQASLVRQLERILNAYPQTAHLDPFYFELVKCTLDFAFLKKALGSLNWAKKQIIILFRKYNSKIRQSRDLEAINKSRNEFYGRAVSVLKQIRQNLEYLDEARKIMRGYPSIKTGIPTIVIAGYPNVGKSTLLKALTGANPEIANYPFTTKKIMLGYFEKRIQFIDTPGLLDRPFEKRNKIEQQAILALKHLAEKIIFILDPSEACGYGIKEQVKLLNELKKMFRIPTIVVMNKIDLASPEQMQKVANINAIRISAEQGKGMEELKKMVL